MDDFKTVRIKKKTLLRFKKFSRKVSGNYSKTLDMVMDFFEWHGFLPSDRFGKSMVEEIIKNRKRTNASIAIIKDIEKSQTLPTMAMLQSLFEHQENDSDFEDDFDFIEKKFPNGKPEEEWIEETTVPRISYDRLEDKMDFLKKDFSYVLDNVKLVKSSFGKPYFKLGLTEGELDKFKRNLKR
ncbi:BfmA/BtgA family mobilization protein [Allomuricauda sp. R78024]|uniref:BfmA/BtgA family mobilization protein n=1 Tax=Allomuricauda sp. R78024 TaxID=3093867 RepID=UPI0037CBEE9A